MEKIIKNNNKRIVWFLTSGMKIGIVSASWVPITKTQRRVNASTLEMKMGRLAGAFRYYTTNNTNNLNLNVIPVSCYPNADTLKYVILKENNGKIGIYSPTG